VCVCAFVLYCNTPENELTGEKPAQLAQSAVWGANRCAYMLKVTERPTSESPLTFLEPS
jgi:hypothetical protein